jgi:hypothetical protein
VKRYGRRKKFMETIWKGIEGFPNYEVSNKGQVKNIKTGRILKPYVNLSGKRGYYKVRLTYAPRKTKQFFVHRLVAEAFIPKEKEEYTDVNHIDENKLNNVVDNLEWCTRAYNTNYGTAQRRHAVTYRKNKGKDIVKYDFKGNELGRFETIVKAALSVGGKA